MLRFKIVIALLLLLWLVYRQTPDDYLHLVVCDVGQGDAIILSYKSWQMLVDGGGGKKVLTCLGSELPFWDKTLEVVVATHPDADHIGGLDDVFQAYHVERFIRTNDSKNTKDFEHLIEAASREKASGGTEVRPKVGENLSPIDQLEVIVLSPQENELAVSAINDEQSETMLSDTTAAIFAKTPSKKIEYNDRSIVLYVRYKDFTALLTGDMEIAGEQALLQSSVIKPITVLKVGHHGAKTSSSSQFVSALRPEISAISVGGNNSYGHPSPLVLKTLTHFDSKVWRTDEDGTIELITNGRWVKSVNFFKNL